MAGDRGPQRAVDLRCHFKPLGWASSARPGRQVSDTQAGHTRMLHPGFLGSREG